MRFIRCGKVVGSILAVLCVEAHADILIGQSADFTGPSAPSVKECTAGAKLVIDAVNEAGGIGGQLVKLVSLDDGFVPQKTFENGEKLARQGAVALFLTRGTPQTLALLPLLVKYDLPLVAPSTGAMVLHKPVNPLVFNVRSSYQHEAQRVVQHLSLVGLKRLAVLRSDDSFGDDAIQGVMRGLLADGLQAVANLKFDRMKADFGSLIPRIIEAKPQAVLFIGSVENVSVGISRLRAAGSKAQAVTLSNNASKGFIDALGDNARGVLVSQVFPSERSMQVPFVNQARDLAKRRGMELTPQMLEGVAAAKVLVHALRIAGPSPTRVSLRKALDGLHDFDLGGMTLSFSPSDHTGLDYVDLAIIGQSGRFER